MTGRLQLAVALAAATVAATGLPRPAGAQDDRDDRGGDNDGDTDYRGKLASTTLGHRETGSVSEPLADGLSPAESASPINRLFTDLRAQLDALHIGGGSWDTRIDARARVVTDDRVQAGRYTGAEYDVRELYAMRRGKRTDFTLGRQFVLELGAVKIDGARFTYRSSKQWQYLGFAGLYPARGSRSVKDDYPTYTDLEMNENRVLPVSAGLGAGYRLKRLYGSAGVVAILPFADDMATERQEKPRVFVTAQGYWRNSDKLDLYHYVVIDVEGAAGPGLTNLSLGGDWHPSPTLRLTAAINRVDTETLNVTAQTQLEDPDAAAVGLVQNNIAVQRISQEEARLGVSAALGERRFEVSVTGRLRRRPEITIDRADGEQQVFPAAKAADLTLSAVDRRSFKGLRLGASVTAVFGLGDTPAENLAKSESKIFQLTAGREFRDGQSEIAADVSLLLSDDDNQGTLCTALDPMSCYGTASVRTIQAGAIAFHRLSSEWLVIGDLHVAHQSLTTDDLMGERVDQPSILTTIGFVRIQYNF